jgi:hypothetical protein
VGTSESNQGICAVGSHDSEAIERGRRLRGWTPAQAVAQRGQKGVVGEHLGPLDDENVRLARARILESDALDAVSSSHAMRRRSTKASTESEPLLPVHSSRIVPSSASSAVAMSELPKTQAESVVTKQARAASLSVFTHSRSASAVLSSQGLELTPPLPRPPRRNRRQTRLPAGPHRPPTRHFKLGERPDA